jgi:16S rRNA G1207 methylase RsmC
MQTMTIEALIQGIHLVLETGPELFSPKGVDQGTSLLLSVVQFDSADKVLDLGCGLSLSLLQDIAAIDHQDSSIHVACAV